MSNKKRLVTVLVFLILVCIFLGGVFLWRATVFKEPTLSHSSAGLQVAQIVIKEAIVKVEMVKSPQDLIRGLSGRDSLGENEGMWFDFGFENTWGIWMKDMKFSIDIIWFDKNLKIVSLAENIAPETYNKVFTPSVPSLYVLELPAGTVEKFGFKEGDEAYIE